MTHQQPTLFPFDNPPPFLPNEGMGPEFLDIIDRFSDGFLVVDDHLIIRYSNKAFGLMFGADKGDSVGRCLWSYLPSFRGTWQEQALCQSREERRALSLEIFAPSNGRWVKTDIYPSGSGFSIYLRDITDQKEAAEEIEVAKKRFYLAAKTDALYDWELTLNQLHWGEGLLDYFGYRSDELQISQWEDVLHPDDKSATITALNNSLANPAVSTWRHQYRLRRKDGRFCYVHERGHIIRNEAGLAIRMIGVMQNITDLKRSEEEVRKLSLIAKETVNAVFITDAEHRIVWVNDAFTKLFEYSLDEATGKMASELLDCDEADVTTVAQMRQKAFANESFRVEILNRTKTGRCLWCDSSYQPVYGNEGEIIQYFCIITDITDRKALERELEQQRRRTTAAVIKAQERERAQVGRELHDNINQVLTTVKLYQGLILDGLGDRQELVTKSSLLLQQSIDEIRILSKQLSAPTLGKIKLKDSVRELLCHVGSTTQFTIEADLAIIEELEVNEELHLAIYRILQEQLTNITRHAQACVVSIRFHLLSGKLLLSITDDGKGFNMRQKRNGIGLTNMRMRAESLGGTFELVSAPSKGCTLLATFPLQ